VNEGEAIPTVVQGKRNLVPEIGAKGILVETDRSDDRGDRSAAGAGGIVNRDWQRLQSTGRLRLRDSSHRGSFCCALFSLFPDVEVAVTRPLELRIKGHT
jgi:hypothetical protein